MSHYDFRILGKEHAAYPNQLDCTHNCTYIIQLLNPATGEIELELCPLSAEQFVGVLLEVIESCHLSA
ncbi:hypothetical protein [Alicyclobacillus dauci]|uniref:Uncharacterized protein n=1 Tax=Alicyclobacillus dauci TaxID=1475485 RepID=A0ABY6YX85_9BACL|nr:hypothetical protein [Alicyclobacillus dauci]WAH35116.1 hypothetical protein NZD86_12375 [Alicyclobacillus dauci]